MALLNLIMRWTHIFCAGMAIGAPVFIRLILLPAATKALDAAHHTALRDALMKRCRMWIYLLITLFLISGFYTYSVVVPQWDVPKWYHMIFGMKFMLALFLFFLASALAGRSKALAFIRDNNKLWLSIYIATVLAIIALSGTMRAVRDHYGKKIDVPTASVGASHLTVK
jgi:uncharacterized membrane protein